MRLVARRGWVGVGFALGIGLLGACSVDHGSDEASPPRRESRLAASPGADAPACKLRLPGQPALPYEFDAIAPTRADFNGDGVLDAVVSNITGGVGILLGAPNGGWAAPLSLVSTGTITTELVVGDFNGDGAPDVLANPVGRIEVLPGQGDGTLGAPLAAITTELSNDLPLQVADFDGDGVLDVLAGALTPQSNLLLFHGQGDGTFGAATTAYAAPTYHYIDAIASGDMNGDGHVDLVVLVEGNVTTLLGAGNGSFTAAGSGVPLSFTQGLTLGDINGDGVLDVVSTEYLQTFLGNGDGTLRAGPSSSPPPGFSSVQLQDVDADGHLDAIAMFQDTSGVGVWFGAGDGTFGAPQMLGAGAAPSVPLVGDFNADGLGDFAVANDDGYITTILGQAIRKWDATSEFSTGIHSTVVVAVDVDGDGRLDLVTGSSACSKALCKTGGGRTPVLTTLLGDHVGTFGAARSSIAEGFYAASLAVADFDGDGRVDVAGAGTTGLETVLGEGNGRFGAASFKVTGEELTAVATADLDGNLWPDLVVTNSKGDAVDVYLGTGGGAFASAVVLTGVSAPGALSLGDFDGDGHVDVEVATKRGIALFSGRGDGTFAAPSIVVSGTITAFVTADLNADGALDLVVSDGAAEASVRLGNGDGSYQTATHHALPDSPTQFVTADIDHDGVLDIVSVGYYPGEVQVLLGKGGGDFHKATLYGTAYDSPSLAVGDFNADGRVDVATVSEYSQSATVLLNKGCR